LPEIFKMKKSIFTCVFVLILCLQAKNVSAQNNPTNIDSLLIGDWSGTSICQLKNSPCHDETVVYHISKKKGIDSFYINASKIINNQEESMGVLPFAYDKKTNQVVSTAYGLWTFNLNGDKMDGTLIVRGDLYRKIALRKRR
jgi:hypothetical protein